MAAERIAGLGLLLIGSVGIFWAVRIEELGLGQNQDPGPRMFPLLLSIVMVIGGGYELVCSFARFRHSTEKQALEPSGEVAEISRRGLLDLALVFVGILAYVVAIAYLGFSISTLFFGVGMMVKLGVRVKLAVLASIGLIVAVQILFVQLFKVQLPTGVFGMAF